MKKRTTKSHSPNNAYNTFKLQRVITDTLTTSHARDATPEIIRREFSKKKSRSKRNSNRLNSIDFATTMGKFVYARNQYRLYVRENGRRQPFVRG